jgi:hypothetical protein
MLPEAKEFRHFAVRRCLKGAAEVAVVFSGVPLPKKWQLSLQGGVYVERAARI